MNNEMIELCSLDVELYKCVTADIATARVVLTEKSAIHIANHHPEAYNIVLVDLKDTILQPDYIFDDENHEDTALIVRRVVPPDSKDEATFIVLRLCTDTQDGKLANSVLSGWRISASRLRNYLRHKAILYKKD